MICSSGQKSCDSTKVVFREGLCDMVMVYFRRVFPTPINLIFGTVGGGRIRFCCRRSSGVLRCCCCCCCLVYLSIHSIQKTKGQCNFLYTDKYSAFQFNQFKVVLIKFFELQCRNVIVSFCHLQSR